jgi:hypothetical protein
MGWPLHLHQMRLATDACRHANAWALTPRFQPYLARSTQLSMFNSQHPFNFHLFNVHLLNIEYCLLNDCWLLIIDRSVLRTVGGVFSVALFSNIAARSFGTLSVHFKTA